MCREQGEVGFALQHQERPSYVPQRRPRPGPREQVPPANLCRPGPRGLGGDPGQQARPNPGNWFIASCRGCAGTCKARRVPHDKGGIGAGRGDCERVFEHN